MSDLSLSLPSFIKPEHANSYRYMMSQLVPTSTAQAPHAAHDFLLGVPEVDDDYWLANVIALAAQLPELDVARLTQLPLPGVRSLVKLYCVLAGRLQFDAMQGYEGEICRAAIEGRLGKDELATMPVRRLLAESGLLEQAQLNYVQQHFALDQREILPAGQGIWLGCDANVVGLNFALEAIAAQSHTELDRVGLILLTRNGTAIPAMLEAAKKFENAVMIHYTCEAELVESLRAKKMRVFIELHGLQNPVTFIELLRSGVANTQLTWAGVAESCPLPFIDGQLLDPILSQSPIASCRALPLRCWLPPPTNFIHIRRGTALGIWSVTPKISKSFLYFAAQLAARLACKLQLWTITPHPYLGPLPENVEIVSQFTDFCPAVLLDTTPLSGGSSCLFALQNGIPVVTMPGTSISSRLGASILLHYGFAEGVVTSLDEYAERVVEFYRLSKMPRIPRQIDWEFVSTVDRFFPADK